MKDKPTEVVQSGVEAWPGRLSKVFTDGLLRDRFRLPVMRNILL
jgi:hypothetical protein